VACLLLAVLPMEAGAIDKGHFTQLKPDTAEQVLLSFQGPAYYLATEPGGNQVGESFDRQPPFASLPFKHAVLLFLDRSEAGAWAQLAWEDRRARYGIREVDLKRILLDQYKTVKDPVSSNPQKPDLIVIESLTAPPVVDTFVHAKTRQPFVYQAQGRAFIPAFFSRTDATAFESKVKAAGKGSFVRQGLDIRSHLALVERYVRSATPVITFGYDAPRWMQRYAGR